MSDATGAKEAGRAKAGGSKRWAKLVPWLIAALCFGYLYSRLAGAAAREGLSLAVYLGGVFEKVSWSRWLALMIPYSFLYFSIDSLVVWRVINWFNTRVSYGAILPIRGSSYILSILNEQVGKGAMALYLNRRHGVPGWEVGSSMLFIMFCEFYYLLTWALVGYLLTWTLVGYLPRSHQLPGAFGVIPVIAAFAALFFVIFCLFFGGRIAPGVTLRHRPVFKAFREARLRHYATILLLRSPALLTAVVVYTLALRLFGVEVGLLEMLAYLPVIFFGAATPGPMRAVAITMWVILFPEREGEMATFGFVQHNFFIFFNASIGLLFLRRANRELFDSAAAP